MKTATIIITFGAAIAFSMGCSTAPENKEGTQKSTAIAAAAPATFMLATGSLHTDLKIPSELLAYRSVDLYAKVTGYVQSLKADVGSFVKEGQILATLEAPEIVSQLAAAESKYKSLQAIYEASNATYERILDASKTPGTISKNDVDIALGKRNSDRAQMEAAKADFRASSTITQYLTIRAPFDGVISVRNVNEGAYLGPAGKGQESPIFTVQQQKHLRLVIEIPEAFKNFIKLDNTVKFTVKAFPSEVFSAKIARRAGVIDKTLRSEHIELDVFNDDMRLYPGMVAEATVGMDETPNTFVVPKKAVVNSTDGVFMIRDSSGIARRVQVMTGRSTDSLVEVFGKTLSPGLKFISKGSEELHDGSPLH